MNGSKDPALSNVLQAFRVIIQNPFCDFFSEDLKLPPLTSTLSKQSWTAGIYILGDMSQLRGIQLRNGVVKNND